MTIPWSAEIAAQEMLAGLGLQKTDADILAYCRVHLRVAYTAGLEAGYKAADRDDRLGVAFRSGTARGA